MFKFVLRRMRRFMQAELMEDLAVLRAEVAALRRDTMLREDVGPIIRQMEAALLTIVLTANKAPERTERYEVLGEKPELR
jgi:hypothetical protein